MALAGDLTASRSTRAARLTPRRSGFFVAEVLATSPLTPNMQRITLTAPKISSVEALGADQFVRLLLPQSGQAELVLPETTDWWPELLALSPAQRPALRNYTIRSLRLERAELDIDFVLHGDTSPGSRWATEATPGTPVGVLAQNRSYAPGPDVQWQLLVGDETALPAIAAILGEAPDGARIDVLLEVPTSDDIQTIAVQPGVGLRWLPREGPHRPPGALATQAVRETNLPDGAGYAWVAGEAGMTAAVRRHLVRAGSLDKSDISFCGYWRQHRPAYD